MLSSVARRCHWAAKLAVRGSKTGGERAAAIYTVIQTCKANGVNPQACVADVTGQVAADWPAARWDELIPWNWAQQPCQAGSASRIFRGLPATLTVDRVSFVSEPPGSPISADLSMI